MEKSKNLYRDIFIGFSFITGIFGFMSGEFIISTLLFGMASLSSNLDFEKQIQA
ncbi:hypothetical protein [Methylomonas sp. AM2-LC]|uniref:hypothetical protein n=1 Tax=Methylomonas sp. AM2-LC TaxID=3153301 RepID=UPI003266DC9C